MKKTTSSDTTEAPDTERTRYMGDPGDVTRKKNGQPNAQYRKFIEARLITNTGGHKKTIAMVIEDKPEPDVSANHRFEVDVMDEFQNYPEAAAFDREPRQVITTAYGTDYILNRVAPSFCEACGRTHDSDNAKIFVGKKTGGAFYSCYKTNAPKFLFPVFASSNCSDEGELLDLDNLVSTEPSEEKSVNTNETIEDGSTDEIDFKVWIREPRPIAQVRRTILQQP